MKRQSLFYTIMVGVILAILGLCGPTAFAFDNQDSTSTFVEADNYCGGSSGMSMSGGCGIPMNPMGGMSGGCGIPSNPGFSGGGARLVPQAPAFDGDAIVPVPEPTNTAAPSMTQLRATVGKPSLDDPAIMKESVSVLDEPVNQGYGYTPVTVMQPVTQLRPVTTYRPVTAWQPTYTPTPAPTAGYQYVERRLGLLGLRGTVINYNEYGNPSIRTTDVSTE